MNKQKSIGWILASILALAVLLSGCSMLGDAVMGGITSGVRKGVSKGVEQEVEKEVAQEAEPAQAKRPSTGPQWNQLMIMQSQMAFSYAFSAGGLWAGQKGYKPGEYTKFQWTMEGEDSITMERAYLKELDDGKQWWRVSWEDSEGLWIWEVLIDADESGTGQMLRMRARDTDGNEGEVPVSGQSVYMPPAELTEESVQGATVGKEKVTVPAGTFQTDHVVFMAATGEGQAEFWLAPQVPGGVVKYLISQKGEGTVWNSDLVEYGKKATTILNSY
jgi:hypothetical protein